jgi:haloalkane dehalogenase
MVVSNTFGWPLAEYKWIKRALGFMGGATMTALNRRFNIVARMSSGRFGVGKHLSRQGRRTFLAPFRARSARETWSELIGDPLRIEDALAAINEDLSSVLRDVPVLTIFGARNDPFGWQDRYSKTFSNARPVVIEKGMHFPFADDPEKFATSIRTWWRDTVT